MILLTVVLDHRLFKKFRIFSWKLIINTCDMTWLILNLDFALKCFATTYGVIPFVSYSYCAFVSYSYCYALLIFIEHSEVIYFHQILIKVCNKKQLLNLFHIVLCCIRSSLMLFSFFFPHTHIL